MTSERRARIAHVLDRRQPDFTVVMENVHDPHNIAAVMRTCDAVGIQEIYVLTTRISRHEQFGKRSSASAAGWLTIREFDDTEACFGVLREKGYRTFATHLGEKARSLYELQLTEPVALVFGNEHDGVTDEALDLCDGNFIIPQMGMVQSLNISVACAVSLYEGLRQRQEAGFYNAARMPETQRAQLEQLWGTGKSIG